MSSSISDNGESGPLAVDAEGQTIGEDYVLGKQIGYGGFSIIKEVTQIKDGKQRKLAVKIVRRQIEGKSDAENEAAQAEFEHEVELWRFLDHRHILPLEAVYKLDEATFCFIPLNSGGTLFDLVRSNRQGLPAALSTSYAYQLAAALRYLHLDARVAHRDVKLENILLERDPKNTDDPGLIRLCDFGMAEWISKDSDTTFSSGPPSPNINNVDRPPQRPYGPADSSTSAFAGGSLEYAAPEILTLCDTKSTLPPDTESCVTGAERSVVSPAVDIWAFGVCIYTLVVGSRPFQNSFQPRVMMAILAGDWDRDILLNKGGQTVLDLVEGCLHMDPAQRATISDVLESAWLSEAVAAAVAQESEAGSAWKL
jgi:serine/threonine protein kinase